MKNFILLFLLTFLSLSLPAQTGSIEGKITLPDSTSILQGINVYLEKTTYGSVTNGSGNYIIKNVPAGSYTLVASGIGYLTVRKELTLPAGEAIQVDFRLTETVTTLGEVVITSGNTGLKDIPGSAHYISPREIQKFSYTDINRTLRAVPGINMQEEDGFGLRPNIGLRGTGVERSSKITVMEDGVLMAPAPYADPAAYYFPTIGRIQAVEILKGSSQIKYGPYTTGGAINLISTQIPDEFGGRVHILGGSFGSRSIHAFAGNVHKNLAYMVETFQYGSDGFKKLDGGGSTGFDKKDYLAKLRVNTNPEAKLYQSLTFKAGQANEVSDETYLGLTEDDFALNPYRRYAASQKDQMNTEHSQFSVTHLIKPIKILSISTTAYRSDFKRNWYKLDKVKDSTGTKTGISDLLDNPTEYDDAYNILTGTNGTSKDALFLRANNRKYYAQGLQSVFGFHFKTNEISHQIDLGIRFHRDQIDRFQWDDEYAMNNGVMQLTKSGKPGTESNRLNTADAIATYIQYKIKYQKFTLTPGVRYENILLNGKDYGKSDPERSGVTLKETNNEVDVVIPGVGIDYQFSKYLGTFVGVHKGFSPPGFREETKPEESVNYEMGVRFTKNSLSGQVVVFYNDYSNLLGSDLAAAGGAGTGDLFNGGQVQSKGLEFQVNYDLLSKNKLSVFSLPLSIVYTYTDAFFVNSFISTFEDWGTVAAGDEFPYLANNQFTFILGLENRRLNINLSGRYMDEMRTSPGQGEIPATEKTDSYFVIDASASFAMHEKISLFANTINLTDEVYIVARRPAGLRPGMPRAFNAGLKVNF